MVFLDDPHVEFAAKNVRNAKENLCRLCTPPVSKYPHQEETVSSLMDANKIEEYYHCPVNFCVVK